jgi:hypothetical protein
MHVAHVIATANFTERNPSLSFLRVGQCLRGATEGREKKGLFRFFFHSFVEVVLSINVVFIY